MNFKKNLELAQIKRDSCRNPTEIFLLKKQHKDLRNENPFFSLVCKRFTETKNKQKVNCLVHFANNSFLKLLEKQA